MATDARPRRLGTLIWVLMTLIVLATLIVQTGGSRRANAASRFIATYVGQRWILFDAASENADPTHPTAISITALCWKRPSRPVPILLPLVSTERCFVHLEPLNGHNLDAAARSRLLSTTSSALSADPRWAGLPTQDGQSIHGLQLLEGVLAMAMVACWWYSRQFFILLASGAPIDGPATPGECRHCGYPTHALPTTICPECGRDHRAPQPS